MAGRVALVTGATSGLGLETAKGLAAEGWSLLLACRDPHRAKVVAEEISAAAPSVSVEPFLLDLASLTSVRSLATNLVQRRERIDLLVNNAGVFCDTRRLTVDGFEMTIGVNFLGTFALTKLLLPLLVRDNVVGNGARIVIVSSAAAAYGRLQPMEGMFVQAPHGFRGYAASKLALVLFTRELSEELVGKGVTVNAVHPGDAATNIWRGESLLMKAVAPVMKRWLRTPAEAARAILRAATASELQSMTGRFLTASGEVPGSGKYEDALLRREIMRRASVAVGLG